MNLMSQENVWANAQSTVNVLALLGFESVRLAIQDFSTQKMTVNPLRRYITFWRQVRKCIFDSNDEVFLVLKFQYTEKKLELCCI